MLHSEEKLDLDLIINLMLTLHYKLFYYLYIFWGNILVYFIQFYICTFQLIEL